LNQNPASISAEPPPPSASPPPSVNRRWLWAVRVLALVNILIALPYALGWLMASFIGLIPIAGFLWVAASSQRALYAQNPRKGLVLMLAVGVATLVMLLPIALIASNGFASWDWTGAVWVAGCTVVPIALLASAIVALRTVGAEPKGERFLGAALLHGFAYLGIPLLGAAIVIPSLVRSPIAANQASAVGSLRTINTAMITYQSTYENGFAPSLEALGPPSPSASSGSTTPATPSCRAADFIDAPLTSGRKSGYVFQLTPGPPAEKTPPGCPVGVQSYTLTARPASSKVGRQSYFTDQTGVIRFTEEDRLATVKDPPLSG